MGATSYRRLTGQGSGGVRAWAWAAALRRAAARLARLIAARRRCATLAARKPQRGRGRRNGRVAAAASSGCGYYDSASYARNFDDGAWKAEEGVSWGVGPSLPACSLARAVSAGVK